MKSRKIVALLALSLFFVVGCGQTEPGPEAKQNNQANGSVTDSSTASTVTTNKKYSSPGILPAEEIQNKQIRIATAKGDIVFELFPDTAPLAVSNFVYLTNQDYYDGLTFHRREEGFVIQGGDPLGNGTGGPGYTIEEETADDYTYQRGIVAMAKTKYPHSTGSQFFIMLADVPLDKSYTIFGRVLEGMDVVDQIKIGDVMTSVAVEEKM